MASLHFELCLSLCPSTSHYKHQAGQSTATRCAHFSITAMLYKSIDTLLIERLLSILGYDGDVIKLIFINLFGDRFIYFAENES